MAVPQPQAFSKSSELLLPEPDLVLQLSLFYQQGRFHLHEVTIVTHLFWGQAATQDLADSLLTSVHVFLELLSLSHLHQQLLFLFQKL